MTITTTVAKPVEITRRRLAALLAATATAASALTWAVTTIAIDTTAEPTRTTTATSQHPALGNPPAVPITATRRQQLATARPIVVADAYHGVGITVCPDGSAPINVADAYHGIGTTLCP